MLSFKKKSGFVAVLGAPNAGKSTFINHVIGTKVSIVSPKVQTTRTNVLGILKASSTEIIFIDTPGIIKPRRRLDRAMVAAAWSTDSTSDVTLLLVDSKKGIDYNTKNIIQKLKSQNRQSVLVINKIDLVKKPDLLELTEELNKLGMFSHTFMISALKGDGITDLIENLAETLPENSWVFPPDQVSNIQMSLLAAEITREKIYLQLREELPYSATVETESWKERRDGSASINQVIYIERDSQKSIILGKGGSKIKKIGTAARKELEEILEQRVHVKLLVKVREKWSDDPNYYRDWGLDFNA